MRLADRYVFGELILPFFIGTLAVLMMLVGNTLFAILPGMLQQHWPVLVVLRVCVLNIPTVLVLTLPVSTALAASLATNRMARDNEFTVMRSAGRPLLRAFVPMFLFGALMSAADIYISDQVVPWAWREQQNVEQYLISNLPTNPVDVGRTITADKYTISFQSAQKISDSKRRLNKVVIVDGATKSSAEYPKITTAQSADYENGIWTLENVVHHWYGPDGMTTLDATAASATLRLQIDFSALSQPMQAGQEQNFSFDDLAQRAQQARIMGNIQEARTFETERYFKLTLALMCLVLSICSPPLGLRFAQKGTSFTGVLLSIITVFVAWNTLLLMKMVALGGYIPIPVAAWSTDILFAGLGLWLFKTQE